MHRRPRSLRTVVALVGLALAGCVDRVAEHRIRGNALARERNFTGALEEYRAGLRERPDDAAILVLQGNALFELDRLEEARRSFEHALRLRGDLVDAHVGMALIAVRGRDYARAARAYRDVIRWMPRDVGTRVNLAKVLDAMGDAAGALREAEAAVALGPGDVAAHYTVGRFALKAGDFARAERAFGRVRELDPERPFGAYGMASLEARRGRVDEALRWLEEAVRKGLSGADLASVETDPSFAGLHGDGRFQTLLAGRR